MKTCKYAEENWVQKASVVKAVSNLLKYCWTNFQGILFHPKLSVQEISHNFLDAWNVF